MRGTIKKTKEFKKNNSVIGERLESKLERIINNSEPIKDGAPIIYTDRADGVRPEYDIRTDRFEIAQDAMDYISRSKEAKRDNVIALRNEEKNSDKNKGNGSAESIQGTD